MTGSLSRRSLLGAGAAGSLALTLGACGGSSSSKGAGGVVKVSVNGMPPSTQPVDRKFFLQDVRAFEKAHPKIKIDAREGYMDPKTFSAKLAGGQLEDVFYVYFSDPAQIIERRQAADISPYLKEVPHLDEVRPDLLKVFTGQDGKVYGLPNGEYSQGLLYNRALFKKAGLNPDRPPATWEEVRAAAKRISALGDGIVGYADYSKNNQGGWHLTSWIYSMGGEVAANRDGHWHAAFDSAAGRRALQALHAMRWSDNSMGSRQLLEIPDVQKLMGSGKLGMYMAGPDNIPTIVKQFERAYEDYGVAPLPGGRATLSGGNGFMVNPKASPEKIRAGVRWLQWKYLNPEREAFVSKRATQQDVPIGLPLDRLMTGEAQKTMDAAHAKYANVPQENYAAFVSGTEQLTHKLEPPKAQEIYTVLDGVMQAVLTKRDADPAKLLPEAAKKVDTLLATVK